MTRPDQDKTNPDSQIINQRYDQEPFQTVEATGSIDDVLEVSRNRSIIDPDLPLYPDVFVKNHTNPKNAEEVANELSAIEELAGGGEPDEYKGNDW